MARAREMAAHLAGCGFRSVSVGATALAWLAATASIPLPSCGLKPRGNDDAVTTFAVPSPIPEESIMGTPLAIDPHEAVEAPSIDAGTVTADAGVDANDSSVPEENREKGDVPPVASAEEGARRLLAAIKADDPALAAEFFFPASAFDLVKAMLSPGTYHKKLEAFYEEDIHTEHDRYFGAHTFEYDSFEMGRCEWMEPLSQGNKLPYWSCRNSRILARSGTKLFDYRIRYMINWGPNWYVIHLGPVRDV